MSWRTLPVGLVDAIHDSVLNPGELPGRAGHKSLDGALARVENRIVYGLVADAFDLAAAYATAIARGHCFNDANKRTAFRTMEVALHFNGIDLDFRTEETGDTIVRLARGDLSEEALAAWLRGLGRFP